MPRVCSNNDSGEACDLVRVVRPVVAAFGELDDAAAADVRVAFGLDDLLAMAFDVVEDQTFPQRQVAQRDLLRIEPPDDRVEQQRAGHGDVGAARLQPGHAQASLQIEVDELLARAVDLLGGDPPVAQRRSCGTAVLRERHGAETQNGSGCADQAIEAGGHDLVEIAAQARLDVLHQLALVTRRERIALDEALGQTNDAKLEALTHDRLPVRRRA